MAEKDMTGENAQVEEPVSPAEIAQMREQIIKLESQNADLLRHLAEFQNRNNEMLQVMKRKEADIDQRLKFAHEKMTLDLLLPLDNLDRAVDAARKAGDKGALAVGVMATLSQILDVLKRFGIAPIEAVGQPFDPMKHQAIQSKPAEDGQEPGSVTAVVQQGFTIHDRVLRPAAVIVAQA